MEEIYNAAGIILVLIIVFLVILLVASLCMRIGAIIRERKYIKMEIKRTSGKEKKYWKRKRRRLWLEIFSFSRKRG